MTLEYYLAELTQRAPGSDREAVLKNTLDLYEKFLTRLDEYELLSKEEKKLLEQYMANPSSFTLAPMNDAAARRETKVRRFREEKELKQKLEVWFIDKERNAYLSSDFLSSIFLATKHDCRAMMTILGDSTWPSYSSIPTRLSRPSIS